MGQIDCSVLFLRIMRTTAPAVPSAGNAKNSAMFTASGAIASLLAIEERAPPTVGLSIPAATIEGEPLAGSSPVTVRVKNPELGA